MKKNCSNRKKKVFEGKVINALTTAARDQAKITCKILEYQEMKGIEAEIAGELTNKYAYEFKQTISGEVQIVRGIRAVGAREAIRFTQAKAFNFIPKFKYEREDLGDGWFREIVFCENPKTKEITRSTCQWKRGDRFGDRTASTNAERNALLKQLPAEMKLLFINYCVKRGFIAKVNVDPALEENQKAVKALADGNQAAEQDGKEKTAALSRIYAIIGGMAVDKDKVRAWLHKSYKVASLKDLSVEVLKKIGRGLADIYGNQPGKTSKVNSNILTLEQFVENMNCIKLNDKGEIIK